MPNGMKSGAGSDPFADDESADDQADESDPELSTDNRAKEIDDELRDELETDDDSTDTESGTAGGTSSGLPFIYARDGVKSARDHTYQLHYLDETYQQEKQFQAEIEELLGEDVYKADLREAALRAAFENPEAVADQLRDWGYDAE